MSDEYNGWANMETWAFNLHWQNDQGTYNQVVEWGRLWAGNSDWQLGRLIIDAVEEMWEEDGESMPLREVGSFWRVDEKETAQAVRESLENES